MNIHGKQLTSEQTWDVVNFVQVLPYAGMREKLGVIIVDATLLMATATKIGRAHV